MLLDSVPTIELPNDNSRPAPTATQDMCTGNRYLPPSPSPILEMFMRKIVKRSMYQDYKGYDVNVTVFYAYVREK